MPGTSTLDRALDVALDGGKYTAVRAPDGTWSILDVPVYPEHVLPAVYGARGELLQPEIPITKAWLETAVLRAKYRAIFDRHVAPAHVNHHAEIVGGPPREVLPAGVFLAKRVGTLHYAGRPTACIYGDFARIPPERFAEIESGKLRFRSVEVLNLRDPEVSSVAFLPTQVPYFRLPMVTIGTKRAATFTTAASLFSSTRPSPVVAFYRAGAAASALCYFAEAAPMGDEGNPAKKKADEKPEQKPDGGAPAAPAAAPAKPAEAAAATPPAAPTEPPANPAAAPAAPANPAAPAQPDPMAAMTACVQRIEQGLTLLLEKAGIAPKDERPGAAADSAGAGQPVPGPKGMQAAPAAPAPTPPPAASPAPAAAPAPAPAAPAATSPELAKAYQERDTAQAALRAQEAARQRDECISGAVARLKPFFLPEADLRADLGRAYAASGPNGVKLYADTVEARFPALPPVDLEGRGDGATAGASTDSAAVMGYQAKGPDAVRAARGFSAAYQRQRKYLGGISEEQFIAAQFEEARRGLNDKPDEE